MLVNCLTCGKEISKDANRCPHCGAGKVQSVGLTAGGKAFGLILLCLVELVLLFIIVHFGSKGMDVTILGFFLIAGIVPIFMVGKAKVREEQAPNE